MIRIGLKHVLNKKSFDGVHSFFIYKDLGHIPYQCAHSKGILVVSPIGMFQLTDLGRFPPGLPIEFTPEGANSHRKVAKDVVLG